MKKIKALFIMIVSVLCLATLASCGKKAKIEVVNVSSMRTKIGVTIKVDDPHTYITASSITATLYETDDDSTKVESVTFDSLDEEEQTKTFSDLKQETTYKLVIKATVDDKSKTYYNEKVSTTNEGSSAENAIEITSKNFEDITYDDDAYYKLVEDIDYEKATVSPLFDATNPFEGHIDGQGHSIKNFKITKSTPYLGLFGYIGIGASITNLKVSGVTIETTKGSNLYVGVLAGCNQGTITNCEVSDVNINHQGTSTSKAFIGGVAGVNAGVIEETYAKDIAISTRTRHENFVGGFVGTNGGIVQSSVEGAHISKCGVDNATITNELASVVVVDKETNNNCQFFTYVGGFAGESRLDITDSYAVSKITTKASYTTGSILKSYELAVGGFAGRIVNYSIIDKCASVTTLTASSKDAYKFYAGVFVGEVVDSIAKNSYAIIKGENNINCVADHTSDEKYSQIEKVCDTPSFGLVGKLTNVFETPVSKCEDMGTFKTNATFASDTAEELGHMSFTDADTSIDTASFDSKVKAIITLNIQ